MTPIITKITVPSRSPGLLRRERLIDFLHENVDRKLLLVTAPAGYGKTTLLVDFAHDTDLPVCWYGLDARDRDPRIFVEHLVASIAQCFPNFGSETRHVLEATRSLADDAIELVGTMVNEMVATIPEWFIIVLDDFHHLTNAEHVNDLLETLIAYQPEHLHMVISSRTVPHNLPIGQLTVKGEIAGLEQKDLRFTPKEVAALFEHNRYIRLAPQEVEGLAEMSEGWIAAILLASCSSWQGTLDIWARARAGDTPVYDYLAGEVLNRLEPALRSFLLASSTLEEMTPRLCVDALGLQDVERHFRELERRNLFADRLPGEADRLRYHTLFRDFLQARLRKESWDTFVELHLQAAIWFEGNGDDEAAAFHYMMAGEPEEAARIISQVAQRLLRTGHLETLVEWMERLPARVVHNRPRLLYYAAEAAVGIGRIEQSSAWLREAETSCRQYDEPLLALILAAQAFNCYSQGQYLESVRIAEKVISLSGLDTVEMREAKVESLRILGACLIKLGRVQEAEAHFRAALREGQDVGNAHRLALIQQGLALSLLYQERHEESLELSRKIVDLCRRLGSPAYLAEALNNLAYILYRIGGYSEALEALQEALETARRIGHRRLEAYILVSLGEVVRDLGDANASIEALTAGIEIARELNFVDLLAFGQDALALALLYADDVPSALVAARAAIEFADRQGGRSQLGRYRTTLGLINLKKGEIEAGIEVLELACEELAQAETHNELARTLLALAYGLFRAGRVQQAMVHLTSALDVYLGGESGGRLLIDSRDIRPVLEKAVSDGVGGKRLVAVLEGAKTFERQARRALRDWQMRTTSAPPSLRIYGFDTGRVEKNGWSIPATEWSTTTARYLFFYFLSYPVRTRERIVADIWPDLRSSRVTGTFHTTKHRMQHALGLNPVLYEEGIYRLNDDLDLWYDVAEFDDLLERARNASPGTALRYLRKAVDLYQGDFLEGCHADWCVQLREILRQRYLEALERLVDGLLDRGRVDDAIPYLHRALAVDDLREDFHRQLMRSYALAGRFDVAIAQYRRCARILGRELGIAPDAKTQALHDAIRTGRFPAA